MSLHKYTLIVTISYLLIYRNVVVKKRHVTYPLLAKKTKRMRNNRGSTRCPMVKRLWSEVQNIKLQKFFSTPNVSLWRFTCVFFISLEYFLKQALVIGSEEIGVHELLFNSIRKSDLDLRKTLYQNIVLSGGSTLFKGKSSQESEIQVGEICSFESIYLTTADKFILSWNFQYFYR